jgi:hypothetical protein
LGCGREMGSGSHAFEEFVCCRKQTLYVAPCKSSRHAFPWDLIDHEV